MSQVEYLKIVNLPLLQIYLTVMPEHVQSSQVKRFRDVNVNIEFGTWIAVHETERISRAADQRGFIVWKNLDATSAFFYGAGTVNKAGISATISWLRSITLRHARGQALVHSDEGVYHFKSFSR